MFESMCKSLASAHLVVGGHAGIMYVFIPPTHRTAYSMHFMPLRSQCFSLTKRMLRRVLTQCLHEASRKLKFAKTNLTLLKTKSARTAFARKNNVNANSTEQTETHQSQSDLKAQTSTVG